MELNSTTRAIKAKKEHDGSHMATLKLVQQTPQSNVRNWHEIEKEIYLQSQVVAGQDEEGMSVFESYCYLHLSGCTIRKNNLFLL